MRGVCPFVVWIALVGVYLSSSTPAQARQKLPQRELRRLIGQLREGSMGARNRAVQRLYLLQDPRANRAVLSLANDDDEQLRARFVWVLSVVRPPGTAAVLRRRLGDSSVAVRKAAAIAVGVLRLAAGPRWLRPLLSDANLQVRGAAIASLVRFGKQGIPTLRAALRSRNAEVVLLAIRALGELQLRQADRELRRMARSARLPEQVRLHASRQLVLRGGASGALVLCELLVRGTKGIRLQAAGALGDDRSAPGARCLRRALEANDGEVRHAAWEALAKRKAATGR